MLYMALNINKIKKNLSCLRAVEYFSLWDAECRVRVFNTQMKMYPIVFPWLSMNGISILQFSQLIFSYIQDSMEMPRAQQMYNTFLKLNTNYYISCYICCDDVCSYFKLVFDVVNLWMEFIPHTHTRTPRKKGLFIANILMTEKKKSLKCVKF